MTFEDTWQEAEKIVGYLFKEEGHVLHNLAVQIPENGIIVELGSFCGKSSRILAEVARDKKSKLYCVDSFVPHFDGVPTPPEEALKSFTQHVLTPFYDNVELIKLDTTEASRYFKKQIDFIFIDADHSLDGVRLDCEHWLPMLKSGGVVAFHDYHSDWKEVKQAADEFVGGWHNVCNEFSIAAFKKP